MASCPTMTQQEDLQTDGQASSEGIKLTSVEAESTASGRESKGAAAAQIPPSKRSRTTFTPAQQTALEQAFKAAPYPDSSAREQISRVTGIAEAKVQVINYARELNSLYCLSLHPIINADLVPKQTG